MTDTREAIAHNHLALLMMNYVEAVRDGRTEHIDANLKTILTALEPAQAGGDVREAVSIARNRFELRADLCHARKAETSAREWEALYWRDI